MAAPLSFAVALRCWGGMGSLGSSSYSPCLLSFDYVPSGAGQSRKLHGLEKLIKNACNCCYPFHKLRNWKFTLQMNLLLQFNTRQLFRPLSIHQWCPVLRDTFSFGKLCVAKSFQNVPISDILAVSCDSDGRSAVWAGM